MTPQLLLLWLSVVGRKAPFSRPRSGKDRETSRRPSSQYDGSRDPEEDTRVIAAEGLMEEYLAFDCKDIRGLSRSSLEHHPLPDNDDEFLPDSFLHDVKEAVSTYSSESSEDCQTVTGADIANSWSAIQSYTGTGVSTERSSVFSWGYDEFDKAASRQVQQMFEEIDELLYEGTAIAQMCGLQDECQQWKSRFPHLRILGSQVVTPTDEGYRWYSTPGSPASRAPGVSHRERESTELSVVGRKAPFSRPRSGKDRETSRRPSSQYDGSRDPEEDTRVIAAEGLMEEYLAFDCKDMDEEAAEKRLGCLTRRHRLGFPPISPYRCMKESVLDEVFDDVWKELVGCMEELIRRHWEGSISDDERNAVTIATSRVDSESPFMLFSALPVVLPRVTQSRVLPFTPNLQSQASRAQAGAGGHHYNLNDLIVIHGIPLQQRNLAAMDKTQPTASDRLSSPLMPLSRNNRLPPISLCEPEHSNPAHTGRHQQHRGTSSRAHSAVVDDMGSLHLQDRLQGPDLHSRPNTTHTFRASRAQAGAGGHHYNLNDLIVIHGIPLQQRNLAAMDKTQEPEERPPLCPGSSAVPSSRPRPRRTLEQSSSSLSRPPQSARRRNPPPRTLHPITPGLSQSGTAGSMDEVIRGTRLPTASDRLSSPLMPLSRNNRLPPISLCEPEHSNPAHTGRHQQHRGTSSRAHSAVVDDMGSLHLQDRLQGPDLHSRPNTTHTFRVSPFLFSSAHTAEVDSHPEAADRDFSRTSR
ncbi:UNVERIFIED_CONTAM: hypothetical protein FKN15_024335 [Acipenser sinensis]